MAFAILLDKPGQMDEPHTALAFSAVFTQVAAECRRIFLRNGEYLAAVIPLEHLELVREGFAHQEMESLTTPIEWDLAHKSLRPGHEWFDGDKPKPF